MVRWCTPDEFVDADKESDLEYSELCNYNGGKWKDNKCEFDDDDKEKKMLKMQAEEFFREQKLKKEMEKREIEEMETAGKERKKAEKERKKE